MEVFLRNKIEYENQTVELMKYRPFDINSYLKFLTELEIERLLSFKSLKRQQEFVATRILRHEIFGFNHIHYNSVGAPYIKDEGYISISHAEGIVGIALNKDYEISLDLETISNQALRLSEKFLSEEEKANLNMESIEEMTKVWSLKEVLYKLSGERGIHFKKQLTLEKKTEDKWLGKIHLNNQTLAVELSTFVQENVVISCNLGQKYELNEYLH
jgi:phosphopantetheinyl transferase